MVVFSILLNKKIQLSRCIINLQIFNTKKCFFYSGDDTGKPRSRCLRRNGGGSFPPSLSRHNSLQHAGSGPQVFRPAPSHNAGQGKVEDADRSDRKRGHNERVGSVIKS